MNYIQPKAPETIAPPANAYRRSGPVIPLVLTAAAMELVYAWILYLDNLKQEVEKFILLILLQGILYFVSVYLAEKISPRRCLLGLVFVAAAAFRFTLFPLYPSLSDDMLRYRWEGKAQQAGYNPYVVRPADSKLEFLRDDTYPAVAGPQYSTLYGPLMEETLWATYILLHSPVAMKLPFILLDLGVVLALFRLLPILGLSPLRAIIYAWSPLTVVEFSASGHNDPLPIFALVLALLFCHSGQQRLSLGALTASALSKVFAAFLLPVFLLRTSWRLLWIPVVLAVVAFAPYGEAWGGLIRGLSEYGAHWRNNPSLYHLIAIVTKNDSQAAKIYLAMVAAAVLYCLARKLPPERACFIILGSVLLLSPNVFPWYLAWIVPLLAIYPNSAWLLLTIVASLSYHVLIPYRTLGLWKENPLFAILEYTPFYALLIAGYVAKEFRSES